MALPRDPVGPSQADDPRRLVQGVDPEMTRLKRTNQSLSHQLLSVKEYCKITKKARRKQSHAPICRGLMTMPLWNLHAVVIK